MSKKNLRDMDKRRKLTPSEWCAVRGLYETETMAVSKIARQYGISHTAIIKKANAENWQVKTEQIKAMADKQVALEMAKEYLPRQKEKITEENFIAATAKLIKELTLEHIDILRKERSLLLNALNQLETIDTQDNDYLRKLKMASDSTKTIIELERRILNMDKAENQPNVSVGFNVSFV
ncbi:MAG: hypothetical protein IKI11_09300 [Neisseriaceae bacterium]|nr:hypothetical protein [Neisseriaceae bacterium]